MLLCGVTQLYVFFDSFTCCDVAHIHMRLIYIYVTRSHMWLIYICDSFTYVSWLIHMLWRDSFAYVKWFVWALTLCDTFTYVTHLHMWLTYICIVTHSRYICIVTHYTYVSWHDTYVSRTICIVTQFTYVSRLILVYICIVTHYTYVSWHDTYVSRTICIMTQFTYVSWLIFVYICIVTRVPGLGQITWWIVCWQKMRGHIWKKLYGTREIVVARTVGLWEHTDSWLGAQIGSVLKPIQTLKEYFWCSRLLRSPWYPLVPNYWSFPHSF